MTRDTLLRQYLKERNIPLDSLEANSIIEGIEWADAHPINPWHKVSEELPKESGSYLVKYTIDSCSVLYDGICHYNECRWINAHLLGNGRISITHWMEIPEIKED